MRRWQLDNKKPLALQLAADARLSQTNYVDDQIWQLALGSGDDAAMALQTRYGGRVGLASLVPMWQHDDRTIYQAVAYHSTPVVTAFAPGYVQLEAELLPDVHITAKYWVAESHAVTGQFTVVNQTSAALSLRFDLYGHVVIRSLERQISILTLQDETNALYLGKFANIDPVVLVEGGKAELTAEGLNAKVGTVLNIAAGGTESIRWAHAALPEMLNSLRLARYWLDVDWQQIEAQVAPAAEAIPQIETGNADWDATIAFAYQHALQAFLRPTDHLPDASFVAAREPINGYSAAGDGSDYIREWSGQAPTTAYLLTRAIACVAPNLAEGVVRNYIATQQDDGYIDWAPGLGGGRKSMLAMPLLARIAWDVYEDTRNKAFLQDVLASLMTFYERWFREDVDADGDGVPEWQSITQTGYAGWQLFVGGVDITLTEAPDMLTYLLSEGMALQMMAHELADDAAGTKLQTRTTEIRAALDDLWQDECFVYRDRDTHATPAGTSVLENAKGDEEHLPAVALPQASRLIVTVTGGTAHKPRMSVTVHGLDAEGAAQEEMLQAEHFTWTYGRGTATTRTVFSQVDRILPTGLSRVYRVSARSVDLNDTDMNTVLPIWNGVLTVEQSEAIVPKLMDTLLAPNGLALYAKSDEPGADPSGVWVFWNALVVEGLLRDCYYAQALDIIKGLLRVQTATLREKGKFTPFYHEEDMLGMGDRMDIGGMVPVHLLFKAFGLHIRQDGSVYVDEMFIWEGPIRVRQHGIDIQRDASQTTVTFPHGEQHVVQAGTSQTLAPRASTRESRDAAGIQLPEKPLLILEEQSSVPVHIEVEIEDDSSETPA